MYYNTNNSDFICVSILENQAKWLAKKHGMGNIIFINDAQVVSKWMKDAVRYGALKRWIFERRRNDPILLSNSTGSKFHSAGAATDKASSYHFHRRNVKKANAKATHLRRKHVDFSDVDVAVLGQFEESRPVDPLQQVQRGGREEEHPEDWPVEDEKDPEADAHGVGPIEHLQHGGSMSTSANGGVVWRSRRHVLQLTHDLCVCKMRTMVPD